MRRGKFMSYSLKRNIWLYRFFDFINGGDKFVVIFFVPFFLSKDFTISQILLLPSVLCASQLLFSIPLGYLAGIWQRRFILFLSALFRGSAWFLMWYSNDYTVMVVAWALVGVGNALHWGSSAAFLYDSLPLYFIRKMP